MSSSGKRAPSYVQIHADADAEAADIPPPSSTNKISGLRPVKEQGANPKEAFGLAKVPLSLVPQTAIALCAIAMKNGAGKYGAYNWRVSKVQSRVYLEACMRHLSALLDGEDFDPATGIPHIAFMMATSAIYADAWMSGMLIDNRPLPGVTGELLSLLNEVPGKPLTPREIEDAISDFVNRRF